MFAAVSLVGEIVAGKYRVERILGEGGMGLVVAAHHLQLDERVAIKFMRREISQNREAIERFLREARAAAKLKSEHIARVHDVGEDGPTGSIYMIMEYLEGEDLSQVVAKGGPLKSETAALYLLQVCEGISEAHSRGIIHRDLKPENLFLIHRANGSPCIKVLDFGISRIEEATNAAAPRMTTTSALVGSPLYMSPEQLASPRDVDVRTDVWSLGVVLYEILSGRPPFTADSLPQLLIRIRETDPAPLPEEIAPALREVVMRCLAKDRTKRFASCAELAAALAPFATADARYARTLAVLPEQSAASLAPPETVQQSVTSLTWNDHTAAANKKKATTRLMMIITTIAACLLLVAGVAVYAFTPLLGWSSHSSSSPPLPPPSAPAPAIPIPTETTISTTTNTLPLPPQQSSSSTFLDTPPSTAPISSQQKRSKPPKPSPSGLPAPPDDRK